MYESSPRSREVANALFQIDRLAEDQIRSILRHIAIDDAVLNEAQCSHVACVINGTLNKAPREGVNASLTCGTSLDAASHWEKSFASHPGHVSATFRRKSRNNGTEADHSTKQVVLFKPEESAPGPTKDASRDVKPSVGFNQDLKGLSIINQGHLTLHYHSYNEASSPSSQPAVVPLKRGLDKSEDEQYSEALSSLMDFDLSPQDLSKSVPISKRPRMEDPEEPEEPEEPETEMVDPETQVPQKKVKQEEEAPAQKGRKNKDLVCTKCGNSFQGKDNKGSKTPCHRHPGMSITAGHLNLNLSRLRR
ncbi:hypothetical protein FJTKL_07321 [Diaporthe vaccinii]|uniref:Uncharacterized protein n=1 Tax=Diaporthe vaccinii TaxID=105482 RepID=A0ABR4EUG4_9PEZI